MKVSSEIPSSKGTNEFHENTFLDFRKVQIAGARGLCYLSDLPGPALASHVISHQRSVSQPKVDFDFKHGFILC